MLKDTENLKLEPSVLAGTVGILQLLTSLQGKDYLDKSGVTSLQISNATHVAWGTGGSMVPEDEYVVYYEMGCR
ncbi:MAG: hypothetical protein HRU25_12665 [Psychrobium sp.]|nr:hypothetical protein [Psychrobium sp.]